MQPWRSTSSSPREVKDFYGAVFKPIDDIIAANEGHNRMVKLIAREEGAPLIDMAAGVDGVWDDDLYLDIVHFTERGNERVADSHVPGAAADPGGTARDASAFSFEASCLSHSWCRYHDAPQCEEGAASGTC